MKVRETNGGELGEERVTGRETEKSSGEQEEGEWKTTAKAIANEGLLTFESGEGSQHKGEGCGESERLIGCNGKQILAAHNMEGKRKQGSGRERRVRKYIPSHPSDASREITTGRQGLGNFFPSLSSLPHLSHCGDGGVPLQLGPCKVVEEELDGTTHLRVGGGRGAGGRGWGGRVEDRGG